MDTNKKEKGYNLRIKILASLAVIGVVLLFYFSVSAFTDNEKKLKIVPAAQSVTRDTFTNCIFNAPFSEVFKWHLRDTLHIAKNLARFNDLNFNAVHSYDDIGSEFYGKVDAPLTSQQTDNYKIFLDSVKEEGHLYGFFERSFLSKYFYGQRLIYEVAQNNGNRTLNYGFVYQTRERGNYEMDGNRTVVHAVPATNPLPGYLCRDIYENFQHSDLLDFRQKEKGTWFIKPVMKIPGNTPPSGKVVRIDVINFKGLLLDSVIITAANFKNKGAYNGQYLEKYFDVNPLLQVSGGTNSTGLNYGHTDRFWTWDDSCKVDFRVYWYGTCEVWFDKMIVDDEIADNLFNPDNKQEIDSRINQEVSNFTNYGGMYTFFTDEVFISQYPCIKYVVEQMRKNTPAPRFSLAVTKEGYMLGLKNESVNNRVILDSIKPDFFQDDHHGIKNYSQPLPATITLSDVKVPKSWIAASNEEYNNKLQYNTLGSRTDVPADNTPGTLLSELVSAKHDVTLYSQTTKFIMQPQIHGWIGFDNASGKYVDGCREPTNEEIQVQAMLSISHGANGLCWFIYNSRIDSNATNPVFYTIGMLNPENGYSIRDMNCYGQNKWAYVSQMNGKINKWMNALNNTNWVSGRSVHQEGANFNYISDIKSIYGDSQAPFSFSYSNLDAVKFWEEAFFAPKDQSDKSKYLLMVNRRCVPPSPFGIGDVRILTIRFNPSQLSESENWILKDVNTGQQITFNKNSVENGGYINLGNSSGDLGYFKPGEGKMFQLIPVIG